MTSDRSDVWRAVREIKTSIGLTPGFLEKISAEPSDWSFVVKVHALIDAALVHLIVEALGKPALSDIIGRLSFEGPTGKVAIVKTLELLPVRSIAFLRRLNTIRNRFSHDVTNIELKLEDIIINEKPSEAEPVWRDLARGFRSDAGWEALNLPSVQFAKDDPRTIILIAAMETIGLIYKSKLVTSIAMRGVS
jgi:hypothetical protein